jgi:hypothetical protein
MVIVTDTMDTTNTTAVMSRQCQEVAAVEVEVAAVEVAVIKTPQIAIFIHINIFFSCIMVDKIE